MLSPYGISMDTGTKWGSLHVFHAHNTSHSTIQQGKHGQYYVSWDKLAGLGEGLTAYKQ